MTTAAEIRAMLRRRHPTNEWALAFEVQDRNTTRSADAVAMNLWPSRGMAIHGFEIKVSRGDWLRELKTPEKAEPVARYCDYWWIVAPEGIVKDGELPDGWGLLEAKKDTLYATVNAPKKTSVPVQREFMAALFRRVSGVDNKEIEAMVKIRVEGERERIRSSYDQDLDREVNRRTRESNTAIEWIAEFEQATGVPFEDVKHNAAALAQAVRLVNEGRVFGEYGSTLETLHRQLRHASENLDAFFAKAPKVEEVGHGG